MEYKILTLPTRFINRSEVERQVNSYLSKGWEILKIEHCESSKGNLLIYHLINRQHNV